MIIGVCGYAGKSKTGVGRVIEELLACFAKNNDNIYYLFTNYDQTCFDGLAKYNNIHIIKYNVTKRASILNILWHQTCYHYWLLRKKCDIAFIPNHIFILFKIIPTVVIIHDLIEFNIKNKFSIFRTLYRRFVMPQIAKKSDFIITVSNHSKGDIVNLFKVSESKIKVVYNGFNRNRFIRYDPQDIENKLKEINLIKGKYILYLGTIDHPGKNVINLIKAFEKLKLNNEIEEDLLLAGGAGYNFKFIKRYISKSIARRFISYIGYVDDEIIPYLYNGARTFVFPSYYEGFGLPLLEAMSCGCPVIAANSSSLPEVVGDAGKLVDPNNIDEIAEAIKSSLCNISERREMIARGFNQIKKFSWEKGANEILKVFDDIIISGRKK